MGIVVVISQEDVGIVVVISQEDVGFIHSSLINPKLMLIYKTTLSMSL